MLISFCKAAGLGAIKTEYNFGDIIPPYLSPLDT